MHADDVFQVRPVGDFWDRIRGELWAELQDFPAPLDPRGWLRLQIVQKYAALIHDAEDNGEHFLGLHLLQKCRVEIESADRAGSRT